MNTRTSAQWLYEARVSPAQRTVVEQLALNRRVVALADEQSRNGAMHETGWERYGLLQRLRQRPRPHRVD